mgnify:CR=1 FL=1
MSPFAKINTSKSPLLYAVIAALLVTLIGGGVLAVSQHKNVTLDVDGERRQVAGTGNGPIAAFTDALAGIGINVRVLDYHEHALSSGSDALAAAYVECAIDGEVRWDTSKPDGQPRRMLETSRAAAEFGFAAKTDLATGLARTIEWFRSIDMSHYRPPTPRF